ncbi:MAG TPA: GlsB/YeaQ/YmgE family stress response membrane protein [Acidimicrobiia bacterium]|nr:GlsB/YeaQ/YmgE family stress response membrane protein [Acidimicrobiia bacterium]
MGEVLSTLVWGLVAGIVIGPLARLVLPGKQNISLVMTIVLGAVGAIVGGFVYDALGGQDTSGIDWIKLLIQVAVAAAVVLIYGGMRKSTA